MRILVVHASRPGSTPLNHNPAKATLSSTGPASRINFFLPPFFVSGAVSCVSCGASVGSGFLLMGPRMAVKV
jgi:hypothetical protein